MCVPAPLSAVLKEVPSEALEELEKHDREKKRIRVQAGHTCAKGSPDPVDNPLE
jgi:hypothetical protein